MNKKMREILAQIDAKTKEAKSFMEGENKDLDKANALMDEVDELRKEYDAEKRIFDAEKARGTEGAPQRSGGDRRKGDRFRRGYRR